MWWSKMASGLPVFAFDDASAGMLVTPECGGLAEVGNGQAFVDLIANLPKMQVLSEQGMRRKGERIFMATTR